MDNALFKPDLFSTPNPVFQPAGSDLLNEIRDILERHYGFDRQKILSVGKLAGLEINSRNFRIVTDTHVYALKRAGARAKIDVIDLQLNISQQLLQKSVLIPHIIKTKTGSFYACDHQAQIWILSIFIEGTYFTGDGMHLSAVAKTIHDFQNTIKNIEDGKKLPLNAGAGTWPKTTEIFQELFSRRTEWSNIFPFTEASILDTEAKYLEDSFDKISTIEKTAKKTIVPTHIDLHPHNILINADGNPVIVDIDSLQRADKVQSIAFATFKLLRQYIVHEKPIDIAGSVKPFMDILNISEPEIWGAAAAAEVLRRIGIIADLNMHEANRQWNQVLHMQLAALHEIPHIFKTEG